MTCTTKPVQASRTADLIFADAIPSQLSTFWCLFLSPALVVQHTLHHGPQGGPEADPALVLVFCCPTEKPASCRTVTATGSGTTGLLPSVALNSKLQTDALLHCGTECQVLTTPACKILGLTQQVRGRDTL